MGFRKLRDGLILVERGDDILYLSQQKIAVLNAAFKGRVEKKRYTVSRSELHYVLWGHKTLPRGPRKGRRKSKRLTTSQSTSMHRTLRKLQAESLISVKTQSVSLTKSGLQTIRYLRRKKLAK